MVVIALAYSLVSILTFLLLAIIVKFLRDKPHDRKAIRDFIQIDIAIISGIFVGHFALANNVRMIAGPYGNPDTVAAVLNIQQCLFSTLLSSIVSLQIVQGPMMWSNTVCHPGPLEDKVPYRRNQWLIA